MSLSNDPNESNRDFCCMIFQDNSPWILFDSFRFDSQESSDSTIPKECFKNPLKAKKICVNLSSSVKEKPMSANLQRVKNESMIGSK